MDYGRAPSARLGDTLTGTARPGRLARASRWVGGNQLKLAALFLAASTSFTVTVLAAAPAPPPPHRLNVPYGRAPAESLTPMSPPMARRSPSRADTAAPAQSPSSTQHPAPRRAIAPSPAPVRPPASPVPSGEEQQGGEQPCNEPATDPQCPDPDDPTGTPSPPPPTDGAEASR
jgi:hypothetical protein